MTIGLTTLAVLTIIAINEIRRSNAKQRKARKEISTVGEAAARKLLEIANTVAPVQDGRIYIEKIDVAAELALMQRPIFYGIRLRANPNEPRGSRFRAKRNWKKVPPRQGEVLASH